MVLLVFIYALKGIDMEKRPSPPSFSQIGRTLKNPSFWVVALLLSLAAGVETGVYSMLPLFLVNERSFGLDSANHLLGLSRLPGLAMVLFSGWITDRLKPAVTILLALCLSGVSLIFLGIGPRDMLTPAIYVQAAAAGCLFPPILSAASGISTARNRALTVSLSLAVSPVLGLGLIPAGIALAGDLGSFSTGLAAAGLLTLAGMALLPMLKRKA
jgi:NNP family nitrate/nitrite transporter-like MFS transporter